MKGRPVQVPPLPPAAHVPRTRATRFDGDGDVGARGHSAEAESDGLSFVNRAARHVSERAGGDGIVNVFENVIGLDLDGDGDVGVHSPAKKASRRAVRADTELSKLVARDKSASLWSELSAPNAKSLETLLRGRALHLATSHPV